MDRVGIGIVGCGHISAAYLTAAPAFPILDIRGLADMNSATAVARAAEFGKKAVPLDALFADPAIDIVLNLTIPKAHVAVGLRALEAGKHVYSEKPLGVRFEDGERLLQRAEALGLRVGSAPDTFLGGAHQTARRLVDAGALGTPVGGTAFFMCPGHERWHANPDFYYAEGGGPMLDMGPYYVTQLVNLLGPVAAVAGMATTPRRERPILSEPRRGETIHVAVPTHVVGTMAFHTGAVVQIGVSFDVAGHRHGPMELYGTAGTLVLPDPNHFGGEIEHLPTGGERTPVPVNAPYADGNYRSIGLADLALALREGRPHRASGALALHVLEVMEAFGRSAEERREIDIATRPERPAPLAESLKDGRLG